MSKCSLIGWVESLTCTEGPLRGERVKTLPFQRRFLRGLARPEVVTAALTMGRGNGKTTLAAALAWGAVSPEGPLHVPRGQTILVAGTLAQARLAFAHVLAWLGDFDRKA